MKILLEDKNIVLVYKPAGTATQTASLSQKDLVSEMKNHIMQNEKKSNPYLAVINRLDQPVEGLVLMAKDSLSAKKLSAQLQSGKIEKHYYAIISGKINPPKGILEDYMRKDSSHNLAVLTNKDDKEGKHAVLEYQVVKQREDISLLDILLKTGRHHQIRLQFSSRNHALLGDDKYATDESKLLTKKNECHQIALLSYQMIFSHPVTGKKISVCAESENPLIQELLRGEV